MMVIKIIVVCWLSAVVGFGILYFITAPFLKRPKK